MIHVAVRVRELVSSNIDTMVGKAARPEKLLHLLRTEIEESLIDLHGDLAKAERRKGRLSDDAASIAKKAEEWTAKAKVAVDHKRDDLARSALLAREDARTQAAKLEEQSGQAAGEVAEISAAIASLQKKRSEVLARLESLPAAETASNNQQASKTDQHLDHIDRMERRVAFTTENTAQPVPASIDAEIAALRRDADLAAELAEMKAASGRTGKRKRTAK